MITKKHMILSRYGLLCRETILSLSGDIFESWNMIVRFVVSDELVIGSFCAYLWDTVVGWGSLSPLLMSVMFQHLDRLQIDTLPLGSIVLV
jgi:hypothetical protein